MKNTEKEKQHFVPQFYLKMFSFENNKKEIGIFNKSNIFFKQNGKLKTQAFKKYFYGKDGFVEDFLGEIENHVSPILKKIIETEKLPERFSTEQVDILMFLLIMDSRNPISKNTFNNSTQLLKERIISKSGKDIRLVKEIEKYQKDDLAHTLQILSAQERIGYCIDLNFKLIKNETNTPFVISDNPFIKYNQFMEIRDYKHSNHNGYGTIGEKFILPLNEKYLLFFYDSNIYKLGNQREKTIVIDNEEEIDQFNLMQYLNANNLIFFNEKITKNYLIQLDEKAKKYNKPNEIHQEIVPDYNSINSEFIMLWTTDLKIDFSIKKLKLLDKSKYIKFDNRLVQLREKAKKYREFKKNN